MERITAATLKTKITPEVEAQLDAIGKKLGLKFLIGKVDLSTAGVKATLPITIETLSEDGKSAEQREFERLAPVYGLEAEDYGRIIEHGRKRYRLYGFRPNGKKNCLRVALCTTGGEYIMSLEHFDKYALPREKTRKAA